MGTKCKSEVETERENGTPTADGLSDHLLLLLLSDHDDDGQKIRPSMGVSLTQSVSQSVRP